MAFYEKQVQTNVTTPTVIKPFENKGGDMLIETAGEFNKLGVQTEDTAKKTYSLSLKNEAQNNMDQLFEKYSADPVKLNQELEKTKSEMFDTIQDDDVKQDFLINYDLKKGSYVNKAQENFNKIEKQKYESSTFDNIYANIKGMGLSLSNGVSGKGTDDDFVNYQYSRDQAIAQINAKDANGLNIFTNDQRRQMTNDIDKNILDSFKATYDSMSKPEKRAFEKKMAADQVSMGRIKDEKGNFSPAFIAQRLDKNLYGDMKKYVKESNDKAKEDELREWNLQKRYAHMDFIKNPTQTNLDNLLKINPEISEDTIDRYQEMIKIEPNFKAETVFQNLKEAKNSLDSLTSLADTTESHKDDILYKTAEYVNKLKQSNIQGKLSNDDLNKQSEMAIRMANDTVFKKQVEAVYGQPDAFDNIAVWFTKGGFLGKSLQEKVENVGLNTLRQTNDLMLAGNFEEAKKVYAEGQKEAIRIRYSKYVDLKQMEDLYKQGKPAIFMMNGKAFKFAGYGVDDVFVEVDPQTGAKI